ncbi:hypothetical protein [Aurantimonas coralicida]|uniref:hypothetical protein n=1 Tax=Aurantimonas coralicida TaxID=182270 RepID=UPI001E33B42B|nr:hypothetical protein [Aurantimonas coralicida]MCD1645293.1 hypothetical protein [Aurantimonas coralicida]
MEDAKTKEWTAADIVAAGVKEYDLRAALEREDERAGRHNAVRGLMVRLGVYPEFCEAVEAPQPADVPHDVVRDAADNVVIAYGMGWDMDGVIDNLRQALSASEAQGCEAVAWLCRDAIMGTTSIIDDREHAERRAAQGPDVWVVRPLFATPAPSTSTEEALRAENARLREALEPFALIAEHDIGTDEADDDLFRPFHSLNRAPRLMVGHLRAAISALSR